MTKGTAKSNFHSKIAKNENFSTRMKKLHDLEISVYWEGLVGEGRPISYQQKETKKERRHDLKNYYFCVLVLTHWF